jgi:hypothetical protein
MYYCNRIKKHESKHDPAESYSFIAVDYKKKYSWFEAVSVFIGKLFNDDITAF